VILPVSQYAVLQGEMGVRAALWRQCRLPLALLRLTQHQAFASSSFSRRVFVHVLGTYPPPPLLVIGRASWHSQWYSTLHCMYMVFPLDPAQQSSKPHMRATIFLCTFA
jgi:hypothetical protein